MSILMKLIDNNPNTLRFDKRLRILFFDMVNIFKCVHVGLCSCWFCVKWIYSEVHHFLFNTEGLLGFSKGKGLADSVITTT